MLRPDVLALIPARGGSKSVPRKNLLLVGGKPLIGHSILQALASRHVTRTIVSTDDAEIAEVAKRFGAEVPFIRPDEFAGDLSPDVDVFRHALEWLRDKERYRPELVVHLRPTGPARRVAVIDEAIDLILAHPGADSLRSVSTPVQSPYKMWRMAPGRTDRLEPLATVRGVREAHSSPRQSLPPVYWQNGYVDVLRPRVVLDRGLMAGDHVLPFLVREPVLELDYPDAIPAIEAALAAIARGEPIAGACDAAGDTRHPV